ncbi:putative formamidopyrimidine-DNA glycosylase, partial [Tothia fuscella]
QIAEIARIVHYLKKNVVGRTIANVKAEVDEIVYGKVGCSAAEFQKAMTGKKVLDARQQGKYFWMVMDSPPHPLMHFGMTGWIKFSNDEAAPYRPPKEEEKVWPPRFLKWELELKGEPECKVAFVDPRRLARIRLIDVDAAEMRNTTPLKENGPDPVIDKDILTQEWLKNKLNSKKVPVKALLLDQANISGVGNWVADEVLYQAKIHPEQYSNTFGDEQIKSLHDSLIGVCTLACELLGDSDKFPADWLMKHRWDKGKKGANVLPNGDKIIHLKVGGRTSAVVPNVQKKTGPVAGDVTEEDMESGKDEDNDEKPGAKKSKKAANAEEEEVYTPKATSRKRKSTGDNDVKEEVKATKKSKKDKPDNSGKRRSGRSVK